MNHLGKILDLSSKKHPLKLAITEPGNGSITYKILSQEVQKVSDLLISHGIGKQDRVGILCPKSIQSVIAILATLRIGAVYIPVDFQAPMARNTQIFDGSRVKALFIDNTLTDDFISRSESESKKTAIPETALDLLSCIYKDKTSNILPNDLAYILYTSGSTGMPKGVMITHQNALVFIQWAIEQFNITSEDVISSIAPFHFDLSIFDLYASLHQGATLVLMNHKIARNPLMISTLVESEKISVIYSTPTLFKLMLRYGKIQRFDHTSLRSILYAGETFPIEPLNELIQSWPTAEFYNLYGPTETNVITWHKVDKDINKYDLENIPIGKGCSYAECKLWHNEWLEIKPGQKGELLVTGNSLAAGYFDMPEKTRSVFIELEGRKWYKTGDIVLVDKHGEFVFIGRADRMIKRKGYRIELGEIESVLRKHPFIKEVAVVSDTDSNNNTIIKAFIIVLLKQEKIPIIEFKKYCNKNLISYMAPDDFIIVTEFPQTSSHKVDYQRLRQINND